jgi:hypothetical protein
VDVSPADAALLISGVGLLSAVPAFVHRETGFGRSKHDRGMARKRVTHRAATGMRCVQHECRRARSWPYDRASQVRRVAYEARSVDPVLRTGSGRARIKPNDSWLGLVGCCEVAHASVEKF